MGRKKLTYSYVKKQFEDDSYKLMSEEYIDAQSKLKYKCPEGHYHSINWCNWQQGKRCPICAGNAKLNIEYIRKSFGKESINFYQTNILTVIPN